MTQAQERVWSEAFSDAELITAVREGDTSAYGVLYERHAAAARTVARQYVRSTADADDVVSDAFARTLSVLQGGGGPGALHEAQGRRCLGRRHGVGSQWWGGSAGGRYRAAGRPNPPSARRGVRSARPLARTV